jgi:MFS family permease
LIAYPSPGERPIYGGIANTLGIFALFSPIIGGLVLQLSSYGVLFMITLVLAVIALLTAFRLFSPERKTAS